MPSLQKKSQKLPVNDSSKRLVPIKGRVYINFFFVSDENLQQLEEYSNGSTKFDLALFFFALTSGIVVSIFTTDLKDKIVFSVLIAIASISLITGIFKYLEFTNSKKKIYKILRKIKKNRCDVIE